MWFTDKFRGWLPNDFAIIFTPPQYNTTKIAIKPQICNVHKSKNSCCYHLEEPTTAAIVKIKRVFMVAFFCVNRY